jgi:hypothetical protein
LHEKLYCFTHPKPTAFVGSFNPSGDDPEIRPDIVREIGDQDRGYNVLVGLGDPALVDGLAAHARWLHRAGLGLFHRFSVRGNQALRSTGTDVYFWPRVRRHPVMRFLCRLDAGARVRMAASHIKGPAVVNALIGLARRGIALEVLAESTLRRVPMAVERSLTDAGIPFKRVARADGLPMHDKFVLVENGGRRWVIFGSFNWTARSYWLNQEIGVISADAELFRAFAERWETLDAEGGP